MHYSPKQVWPHRKAENGEWIMCLKGSCARKQKQIATNTIAYKFRWLRLQYHVRQCVEHQRQTSEQDGTPPSPVSTLQHFFKTAKTTTSTTSAQDWKPAPSHNPCGLVDLSVAVQKARLSPEDILNVGGMEAILNMFLKLDATAKKVTPQQSCLV